MKPNQKQEAGQKAAPLYRRVKKWVAEEQRRHQEAAAAERANKKAMNQKPSHFSAMGVPSCSRWGKIEIEILAWAYVTGQARAGDEWKPVTPSEAAACLTDQERDLCHPYLSALCGTSALFDNQSGRYAKWWAMIAAQLNDAAGASAVGGFWRISK